MSAEQEHGTTQPASDGQEAQTREYSDRTEAEMSPEEIAFWDRARNVPEELKWNNMLEKRAKSPELEKGIFDPKPDFVNFYNLKDFRGNPLKLNHRYYLDLENKPIGKYLLDYADNTRQIVFNSIYHHGLHFKFQAYSSKHIVNPVNIEWPGGEDWRGTDWLCGNGSDGGDIRMGKNRLLSAWSFRNEGRDLSGHYCYEMWTDSTEVVGIGWDIQLPFSSYDRIGWDSKWELLAGSRNTFKVKFIIKEDLDGWTLPPRKPYNYWCLPGYSGPPEEPPLFDWDLLIPPGGTGLIGIPRSGTENEG